MSDYDDYPGGCYIELNDINGDLTNNILVPYDFNYILGKINLNNRAGSKTGSSLSSSADSRNKLNYKLIKYIINNTSVHTAEMLYYQFTKGMSHERSTRNTIHNNT